MRCVDFDVEYGSILWKVGPAAMAKEARQVASLLYAEY